MVVFHIIFGNSRDSYFQESAKCKSLDQRLQNYLFIFFHVEDNDTIFFDSWLCYLACFLRKLGVWEKIHLKFVKPSEMKNLPWDREEGSETVWDTVKPWELRGLNKYHLAFPRFEQFVKLADWMDL